MDPHKISFVDIFTGDEHTIELPSFHVADQFVIMLHAKGFPAWHTKERN